MSKTFRSLTKVQQEKTMSSAVIAHGKNTKKLSVLIEDLRDILISGTVHKTGRSGESVLKAFETLIEEFFKLQEEQKTFLLEMGMILGELDYHARKRDRTKGVLPASLERNFHQSDGCEKIG